MRIMRSTMRLTLGFLLVGLMAACAAMEQTIEQVEADQASVIVVEQRFADAPGVFLVFKEGYSGNTFHVTRYQTKTSLAHIERIKAAPGYQVADKPTASEVEELFFQSETWEESDGPPELTWAEQGQVQTTYGAVNYQMFDADGLSCVGLTRGWGQPGADNSLNAYLNWVKGYFCEASSALTKADAETLINSVQIKR